MTDLRPNFRQPSTAGTSGSVPPPIECVYGRAIHFHEVDPMGIVWFGNYCRLMDEAGARLRAACGLSYEDFRREGIMAPVKRIQVDYKLPLMLAEEVRVAARMPWNDAIRLDTEFTLYKQDGRIAATGWMVQLLTKADDMSPILVEVPMVAQLRERWRRGEFHRGPMEPAQADGMGGAAASLPADDGAAVPPVGPWAAVRPGPGMSHGR